MGSIYFFLKNMVITFVVVSILQINIGSKTMEQRLMSLVRKDLAPMFLDKDKLLVDGDPVQLTRKQMESLKKEIKNSETYKKAKAGAKEVLLDEIQDIFKSSKDEDSNED